MRRTSGVAGFARWAAGRGLFRCPTDYGPDATDYSRENPIHRHTPTRDRRLGVRDFATVKSDGMVRIGCAINVNALGNRVHVPDHFCSRLEIVGSLLLHFQLGAWRVIIVTANL